MYIKDDEINRIFNEKNWKTAHNYYKDNTIINMSVIKYNNEYHIDVTLKYMVVLLLAILLLIQAEK